MFPVCTLHMRKRPQNCLQISGLTNMQTLTTVSVLCRQTLQYSSGTLVTALVTCE
jgi:hypothetical protein